MAKSQQKEMQLMWSKCCKEKVRKNLKTHLKIVEISTTKTKREKLLSLNAKKWQENGFVMFEKNGFLNLKKLEMVQKFINTKS